MEFYEYPTLSLEIYASQLSLVEILSLYELSLKTFIYINTFLELFERTRINLCIQDKDMCNMDETMY